MNYVQQKISEFRNLHPTMDERLVDLYILLVFVKGEDVTLEDVHDAWSIWKNKIRSDHRSLVPFDELTPEIQNYDQKYVDSIKFVSGDRMFRVYRYNEFTQEYQWTEWSKVPVGSDFSDCPYQVEFKAGR